MSYLRNAWYVAALSSELKDNVISRELLGKQMMICRMGDGVAVLEDSCPHRFAPLSRGKRHDASIECGYHGLRFDRMGKCVLNPHGDGRAPARAQVTAWPTMERYGFIWFWPGDPSMADPSLIPAYPFNADPTTFAVVYGYIDVAANYQLLVDNLLDLSHVEYLHPLFAQPGGVAAHQTSFAVDGATVMSRRLKPNVEIQGLARFFWTSPSKRFDARSNMTWMPPSALIFDLGGTECGAPEAEGVCLPNAHLVTPANELRSHYFWSIARNRRIDDLEASEKLQSVTQNIFLTEDIPMVEAQQRNIGSVTDILSLRPVTLEPDAPAVRARLILADLIKCEAEEGSAACSGTATP